LSYINGLRRHFRVVETLDTLDAEISVARRPGKTLADLWMFLKSNIKTQAAGRDIVDFSSRPTSALDPALSPPRGTANESLQPNPVSVRNLNAISLQKMKGFPMADARCGCGALTLTLSEPSKLVVACHCLDCQRRTGAPFGVGAFYPVDVVAISGTRKEFTRDAASGGKVHSYFCPNCGSTIYWRADNLPSLIGVAIGALADPKYPAPVRSVFEQSKHNWVQIDGAVEHFQQSSVTKNSS
jgi:hypothetical protein